ncbi:hypothetical protein N0V94_006906 [Neodidymelliopsis sp. IMI 364377]|nr:hypothetical protein N0V94_006906 [Neodidymelliopsis sp. IMI 364377]
MLATSWIRELIPTQITVVQIMARQTMARTIPTLETSLILILIQISIIVAQVQMLEQVEVAHLLVAAQNLSFIPPIHVKARLKPLAVLDLTMSSIAMPAVQVCQMTLVSKQIAMYKNKLVNAVNEASVDEPRSTANPHESEFLNLLDPRVDRNAVKQTRSSGS